MATIISQNPYYFSLNLTIILVLFFNLKSCCYCLNISNTQSWSPAGATWYGPRNGAGSDGGACGFQDTVEIPPLSKLVSAGGPSLFKSGKGCGACFQVKCTTNSLCSGNPVQVVITDECPGCTAEAVHFDLSSTAFGAMAISGHADQLLNVGVLQIQYIRVPCNFPGATVAFHVDLGANPYYFSTVIEYEDGGGEVGSVELQQGGSNSWLPMSQSWGSVWKLNSGSALTGPISLRLTSLESHKTIVANAVIPAGWKPGQTYRSIVNFPPTF
ncbi:putative expansin-B2 [Euphorbia lathyris]|uniref:putative expansin-B2 n=1 Tax=Euphorbia lathyris TaxID=212925 RepID=UPI0033136C67